MCIPSCSHVKRCCNHYCCKSMFTQKSNRIEVMKKAKKKKKFTWLWTHTHIFRRYSTCVIQRPTTSGLRAIGTPNLQRGLWVQISRSAFTADPWRNGSASDSSLFGISWRLSVRIGLGSIPFKLLFLHLFTLIFFMCCLGFKVSRTQLSI